MAKEIKLVTLVPGQQAPEGSTGIGYNEGIIWYGDVGTLPVEYASTDMDLTIYKNLSALSRINTDVNNYITNYYDAGTQQSFNGIYSKRSTLDTVRDYLDPVWDWISTIMVYYYGIKSDILAANLEDFGLITWDFSQFDATKPDVTLQVLMESL
jgi:hypothetical protein